MTENIKSLSIEVPHRISGFFEIVDEIDGKKIMYPEHIGSRGAGFNLNAVGKTTIIVEPLDNNEEDIIKIYINNEEFNEKAETTYFIVKYITSYLKNPISIKVYHNFDLPVGCGYGASGSGALGTIFGLNKILNLRLSYSERGRVAHIAEVINRTGLGTVCGLLAGGLCVLKEPGYPCIYESIPVPENLIIICGSFGAIQTKSVLTSPHLKLKIKEAGKKALKKLLNTPNIKTFITASFEFVKDTNILNILNLSKIEELIEDLNNLNIYGASMNQLGRSVYAICEKSDQKKVLETFDGFKPEIKIYISAINKNRPRFLPIT
ncbi:MAG: pantoate kinase [Promethearchaeota archaeon]